MDNITNSEQDSTVRVISRASLAQRARREWEGFSKHARDEEDSSIRVISKGSLVQRARREREAFAKRVRFEQDIIARVLQIMRARREREALAERAQLGLAERAQLELAKRAQLEQDTIAQVSPLGQPNVGIVSTLRVAPLRRPSVDIVIRDEVDLNAISTRPSKEQENERAKINSKGKEKMSAVSADKENSCAVVILQVDQERSLAAICTIEVGTSRKQSHNRINVTIYGKDWMQIDRDQIRINSNTLCQWRSNKIIVHAPQWTPYKYI